MSSTTNHYGLIKPGEEEFYDISVPNTNMDIMDTELKAVSDDVAAHLAETAPHKFVDNGVTYRWGLSVVGGVLMFNYEEVV